MDNIHETSLLNARKWTCTCDFVHITLSCCHSVESQYSIFAVISLFGAKWIPLLMHRERNWKTPNSNSFQYAIPVVWVSWLASVLFILFLSYIISNNIKYLFKDTKWANVNPFEWSNSSAYTQLTGADWPTDWVTLRTNQCRERERVKLSDNETNAKHAAWCSSKGFILFLRHSHTRSTNIQRHTSDMHIIIA